MEYLLHTTITALLQYHPHPDKSFLFSKKTPVNTGNHSSKIKIAGQ